MKLLIFTVFLLDFSFESHIIKSGFLILDS